MRYNIVFIIITFIISSCNMYSDNIVKNIYNNNYNEMKLKGKLEKTFNYNKVVNYCYSRIMSAKNSWIIEEVISASTNSKRPILSKRININPTTGEKYLLPAKFSNVNSYLSVIGVTDNDNIYADDPFEKSGQGICWNPKNGEILWERFKVGLKNKFILSNVGLFYLHNEYSEYYIFKVNKDNGEIIWRLEIADEDYQWYFDNVYLWVLTKNALKRIELQNKEVKAVLFDYKYKDITFYSQKETLLIEINRETIILIDKNSLSITGIIKLNEYFNTKNMISHLAKNFLIVYQPLKNNNSVSIYDINIKKVKLEQRYYLKYPSSIKVGLYDEYIILEDNKQIRGIDPETLETTWWIDLDENMKNAHVEWLDWRGVLVVSDNEIACYAPKKKQQYCFLWQESQKDHHSRVRSHHLQIPLGWRPACQD